MLQMINHSVDPKLLKDALSKIDNNEFKTSLNVPTGDFFYDPWTIKPEFKNTVWEDILNSLPFDKGEARIIVLKPGTSYYCHADADDRWHLNLQSEFGFICDIDQSLMYKLLSDGNWYEMNAGRRHTAANFGSIDRIQLVVRQLLKKNNLLDPVPVKIITKTQTVDFRYQFDNTVSLWLNHANKKGIICDFKFVDTEVSFKVERNSLQSLTEIVPDIFEVVV
jgi:hypothetical protein